MRAVVLSGTVHEIFEPTEEIYNMNTLHTNNQYASEPAYLYSTHTSGSTCFYNAQQAISSFTNTNTLQSGRILFPTIQTQQMQQKANQQHFVQDLFQECQPTVIMNPQKQFNKANFERQPVIQQPHGEHISYQQTSVSQNYPVVYSNNNNNSHNVSRGNGLSVLQSANPNNEDLIRLLNADHVVVGKQTRSVISQQGIVQNQTSTPATSHPVIRQSTRAQQVNSDSRNSLHLVNPTQTRAPLNKTIEEKLSRSSAVNAQKSNINSPNKMLSISVTRPTSSLLVSKPSVSSVVTPFTVPRKKKRVLSPPATSHNDSDIFAFLNSPMPAKKPAEKCDITRSDLPEFCLFDGERLRQEEEHRKTTIFDNPHCSGEQNTAHDVSLPKSELSKNNNRIPNSVLCSSSCATSSSTATSSSLLKLDEESDKATPLQISGNETSLLIATSSSYPVLNNASPINDSTFNSGDSITVRHPDKTAKNPTEKYSSPGIGGSEKIPEIQISSNLLTKEEETTVNLREVSDVSLLIEEASDSPLNSSDRKDATAGEDECMPMIISYYSLNPASVADDKKTKDSHNNSSDQTFSEEKTGKISDKDSPTNTISSKSHSMSTSSAMVKKKTRRSLDDDEDYIPEVVKKRKYGRKKPLAKFLDYIPNKKAIRKKTVDERPLKQTMTKQKATNETLNKRASSKSPPAASTLIEDVSRRRISSGNKKNNQKIKDSYLDCATSLAPQRSRENFVRSADVVQKKILFFALDGATSSSYKGTPHSNIVSMSKPALIDSGLNSWINSAQVKTSHDRESNAGNVTNVTPVRKSPRFSGHGKPRDASGESFKSLKYSRNRAVDVSRFESKSRSFRKSSHSTSVKPPVCFVNPSRITPSSSSSRDFPAENLVTRDGEILKEGKNITCAGASRSVVDTKLLSNTDTPRCSFGAEKVTNDLQPLDLTVRKRISSPAPVAGKQAHPPIVDNDILIEATARYPASSSLRGVGSSKLQDSSKSMETSQTPSRMPNQKSSVGLPLSTETIITVDKAMSAVTAVRSCTTKPSHRLSPCHIRNPTASVTVSSNFTNLSQKSLGTVDVQKSSLSQDRINCYRNPKQSSSNVRTLELKRISKETLLNYSSGAPTSKPTKPGTDVFHPASRMHQLPLTRKPTDQRKNSTQHKKLHSEETVKWTKPIPIASLLKKSRADPAEFSDISDTENDGSSRKQSHNNSRKASGKATKFWLEHLEKRIGYGGKRLPVVLYHEPKIIPMERVSCNEETSAQRTVENPSLDAEHPRILLQKTTPLFQDVGASSSTRGKIQASESSAPKMHSSKPVPAGVGPKMINILSVKDFRKDRDVFQLEDKQSSTGLGSVSTSMGNKKRTRKKLNQLVEDIHKLKTGYRIGEIKTGYNVLGGKLLGIVMTDESCKISESVDKERSSEQASLEADQKPSAIVVQVLNQEHRDAGSEDKINQDKPAKVQDVATHSQESDSVVMEAHGNISDSTGKQLDVASHFPGERKVTLGTNENVPDDPVTSFEDKIQHEDEAVEVTKGVEEVNEIAKDSHESFNDSQESNLLELKNKYLPDSQSSLEAQEACCDEFDNMCMQRIEDSPPESKSSTATGEDQASVEKTSVCQEEELEKQIEDSPPKRHSSTAKSEDQDSVEKTSVCQEEDLGKQIEESPAFQKDPSIESTSQIVDESKETISVAEKESELATSTILQEEKKKDTIILNDSKIDIDSEKDDVRETKEDTPRAIELEKSNFSIQAKKSQNRKDAAEDENKVLSNLDIKIKKEYCEDVSAPEKNLPRKRLFGHSALEPYFIKKERSEDISPVKKTGYSPTGSMECTESTIKRRKLIKKDEEKKVTKKKKNTTYILLSDSSESSEEHETCGNIFTNLKESFGREDGRADKIVRKRKLQHTNSNHSNNSFQENDETLHNLEEFMSEMFPSVEKEVIEKTGEQSKDTESPKAVEMENVVRNWEDGDHNKEVSELRGLADATPDVPVDVEARDRSKEASELRGLEEGSTDVHKIQDENCLMNKTSNECILEKNSGKMNPYPEHWKKRIQKRSLDEGCSIPRRKNARMMGRWSKTEIPKVQLPILPPAYNVQEQVTHQPKMDQTIYLTMQSLINLNLVIDTGSGKKNRIKRVNESSNSGKTQKIDWNSISKHNSTVSNAAKKPPNSLCPRDEKVVLPKGSWKKVPFDQRGIQPMLVSSPSETQCFIAGNKETTLKRSRPLSRVNVHHSKEEEMNVFTEGPSSKRRKQMNKNTSATHTNKLKVQQSRIELQPEVPSFRATPSRVYKKIQSSTSRLKHSRRPPIRLTGKMTDKYGCNVVWKTRDKVRLKECRIKLVRLDDYK